VTLHLKRLVVTCLVVAPCLLLSEGALSAQTTRSIIQRILVKVNGEIFTQTDLVQRQIEVLQSDKKMSATPRDIQTNAALASVLVEITPGILLDVVDELLIVQRGRELGFKMTEEIFKQSLDDLKKRFSLDDAGLRAGLAQEGFTLETYRAVAERQWIISQVQRNEIMSKAALTNEEARQYYNTHRDEFLMPATVSVREILVAVPTVMQDGKPVFSVGADEEAKAKIAAIRERAVKGEDYTKLVTELSESPSKAAGGLIPQIKLGDIDPSLRAALEKVPAGGVSEPIRMTSGWAIFRVEEKSEAKPKPFADVHEEIAAKVYAERVEGESQKYVNKLRVQALIEWKDEEMKKAYEKALAERTSAAAK
jgi:parvulin-like peptidyl-prolyl isomerase